MKTTKYIGTLVFVLMISSFLSTSKAQMNSLYFMYGPNSDARIFLQEYLNPYTDILGSNLNGSWYNTARTHKLGGIDVTATFGIAFAPPEALQYDLSMVTGISGSINGASIAPTALGTLTDRPELVFNDQIVNGIGELETHERVRYIHPDGEGRDFVPLPMAQISVGLPFGTEISARFVPSVDLGFGSETGLWGIGGKHSISQWVPIIKKLGFIDIAVQGGYTKVTSSIHQILPPVAEIDPNPIANWDDQFLVMDVHGWTVNLIASQTIPIVTIYEGIGYASSIAEIAMIGHYPVNDVISDPTSPDFGSTTYTVAEDPIEEMIIDGYRGLRLNAGIRFKLGVFTIHYDFTRTQHTTHTGGLGFTFR